MSAITPVWKHGYGMAMRASQQHGAEQDRLAAVREIPSGWLAQMALADPSASRMLAAGRGAREPARASLNWREGCSGEKRLYPIMFMLNFT